MIWHVSALSTFVEIAQLIFLLLEVAYQERFESISSGLAILPRIALAAATAGPAR
jgi:hypothetical protein